MHLLAQQAPEDAATAGKWATIVVLTLVFIALNYKRWTRPSGGERLKINPGVIITAVAVGMGAFGMFLDVLNWTWTADFSKWVTNDLLHLNATVAPWVWLAASIGMRSAQIWQGEKGPVRKLLDWVPDPVESVLIIVFGGLGGLAMNSSDIWSKWFEGWGTIVEAFGKMFPLTGALFGV